jgi:radical SAM protein with 4Fe4S-binding SPASM domain
MFRKYLNTFLSRFSYHNRLLKPLNKPSPFLIETTSVCNLACKMCPYPLLVRPKGFMSEFIFKKTIDALAPTSHMVRLHGLGEPLLDKRIGSLIGYAASKGIRVEISTNCTALTEQKSQEILKSGLFQIICSLDGATAETYEHIRKNSDFERVVGNIHGFLKQKAQLKSKVRVVLQIILMDETMKEVDEFVRQWEPYKKEGVVDELRMKRFSTWAKQVEGAQDMATDALRYYPGREGGKKVPCLYLWESVSVLQDGRVVPCCLDYEGKLTMGDLNKQSMAEIWHGKEYQELRRQHLSGKVENEMCRNCLEFPKIQPDLFYPFNKSGIRGLFTLAKFLLGKKTIVENVENEPADVAGLKSSVD